MGQPLSPPEPVPAIFWPEQVRPTTVTVSSVLLLVKAVLSLGGALLTAANRDVITEALDKQAQELGSGFAGPAPELVGYGLTAGLSFAIVGAGLYVALAVFLSQGSYLARVVTWLVCGLALFGISSGVQGIATDNEFFPTWYIAYEFTSAAVGALLYVAVIVLLLLPVSNAFFNPKLPSQR